MDGEEFDQVLSWHFGVREEMDRVVEVFQEEQGAAIEDAALDPEGLREIVTEAPVVQAVNSLFTQAVNERASDIHLRYRRKACGCATGSTGCCWMPLACRNIFMLLF